LYRNYLADPASVGEDWRIFFAGFELASGSAPRAAAETAPAAAPRPESVEDTRRSSRRSSLAPSAGGIPDPVHSHRELGHLVASLDPLGDNLASHPLLELSQFGMSDADLTRALEIPSFKAKPVARVGEIIEHLRATYCGTVAVEYMYFQSKERRE